MKGLDLYDISFSFYSTNLQSNTFNATKLLFDCQYLYVNHSAPTPLTISAPKSAVVAANDSGRFARFKCLIDKFQELKCFEAGISQDRSDKTGEVTQLLSVGWGTSDVFSSYLMYPHRMGRFLAQEISLIVLTRYYGRVYYFRHHLIMHIILKL
jgi:hypothetical protein